MMRLVFIFALLVGLSGCADGQKPKIEEIVGVWSNPDGARIEFNQDGTFEAQYLPASIFIHPSDEFIDAHFSGSGNWQVSSNKQSWDQLPWDIVISFTKVSEPKFSSSTSLLVSGDNFMENTPPWNYLFKWEEEEGGKRYKLEKE